jgi:hypothetical protein
MWAKPIPAVMRRYEILKNLCHEYSVVETDTTVPVQIGTNYY